MKKLFYYFSIFITLGTAGCFGMNQENIFPKNLPTPPGLKITVTEKVEKEELCATREFSFDVFDQRDDKKIGYMIILVAENVCDDTKAKDKFGSYFFDARKIAQERGGSEICAKLNLFKIIDTSLRGQGLGKKLFLYAATGIKMCYPDAVYFLFASLLDEEDIGNAAKKRALFAFYRDCGAIQVDGGPFFYMDLSKLDFGIFTPKSKL